MTETETKPNAPVAAESDLKELGLTAAADELLNKRELARKLRIAFEFHRASIGQIYVLCGNWRIFQKTTHPESNAGRKDE